ncbi:sulfite oxidase, partial [Streptomyces sp. NPDC057674]
MPNSPAPARRSVLKVLAAAPAVSALGGLATVTTASAAAAHAPARPAAPAPAVPLAAPGIVKALPAAHFTVRGTNAEARFDGFGDTGLLTPVDRFFVRNHTTTPVLDA